MTNMIREKPWAVKEISVLLFPEPIEKEEWITIQAWPANEEVEGDEGHISIYEGPQERVEAHESEWCYEEIDMEGARLLRDFLIYAIPEKAND